MGWRTPKRSDYTLKGTTEAEILKRIEDAIGRNHKLLKQGSTRISPERILYWAKMSVN